MSPVFAVSHVSGTTFLGKESASGASRRSEPQFELPTQKASWTTCVAKLIARGAISKG